MAFGSPQWMYSSGSYELEQSLKFNDTDSPYLSRTPASSGNLNTWTWSGWIKPSALSQSNSFIFSCAQNSNAIYLSGGRLSFEYYSGSVNKYLITSRLFRDPSAWYHIIAVWNTTDSTETDRMKLYVNGVKETSFHQSAYPTQNLNSYINTAIEHQVGNKAWTVVAAQSANCLISEVNFIDGQALTPADFGQTGTYGEWKPKEYGGTYGTNGFYLPFKNDYTVEGFSTVTYKGNGTSQYIGGTGFQPDLTWIKRRNDSNSHRLQNSVTGSLNSLSSNQTGAELVESDGDGVLSFNPDGFRVGYNDSNMWNGSGATYVAWNWDMGGTAKTVTAANGTVHSTTQKKMGSSGIRYDGNNELSTPHHDDFTFGTSDFTIEMWFYVDSSSHEKPLMSKGYYTVGVNGGWMARVDEWASRHLNFSYGDSRGNSQQYLSAANSFNRDAWNHIAFVRRYGTDFKAYLNGTAVADTRSDDLANTDFLANNADLMIGHETFYQSGNNGHFWGYLDEIRVSKTARYTANFTPSTTYFDGDSNTTLLIHSNEANNDTSFVDSSSVEYNSDGSINCFVQAKPTYGQSIVSYVGNTTAGATVGHGLSSAPEMIIIKNRDRAYDWIVWHDSLADDHHLRLNGTHAAINSSTRFNSTDPSSTVFTLGSQDDTNGVSGANDDLIAYCFHSVTGYSKFGSYTGGGGTEVTTTTGFAPAFVMVKNTNTASNWEMFDNVRNPTAPQNLKLGANLSAAENGSDLGNLTQNNLEFLSNGFKTLGNFTDTNESGSTFIYMAFADKREYAYWLDQSGNNNDWTSNNLTESDISVDSPTNNFATWNPLDKGDQVTVAEGNTQLTFSGASGHSIRSTFSMSSGKWYCEIYVGDNSSLGIIKQNAKIVPSSGSLWPGANGFGSGGSYAYAPDGRIVTNSSYSSYGTNPVAGDILGIAFDSDNGKIYFSLNGVWQNSSNPESATNPAYTGISGTFAFAAGYWTTPGSNKVILNCGQDSSFAGAKTAQGNQDGNDIGDFYYTPPTGFLALCTKNLPDVAVKPQEHFNTVLYSGNGATSHAITGLGFQPDFNWIKRRNSSNSHVLHDSVRGKSGSNYLYLHSNSTNAEAVQTDEDGVHSFDSDGFTVGYNGSGIWNNSSGTYVAWNWKAPTSSNLTAAGERSMATTSKLNADAKFEIITYTGNGTAGAKIGHSLGVAPELLIIRRRNAANTWTIYCPPAVDETKKIHLETTDAAVSNGTTLNSTAPTSTAITLGNDNRSNGNGDTYVIYAFASVDGYSKFGSYIGNGNANGPFVYTGFRPAFVMVKSSSMSNSETNWVIWDNERNGYNDNVQVFANQSWAEGQRDDNAGAGIAELDILSNGFKHRDATWAQNGQGGATFIYIAFAETPFKYSNAR